jgi:hypothetical protein
MNLSRLTLRRNRYEPRRQLPDRAGLRVPSNFGAILAVKDSFAPVAPVALNVRRQKSCLAATLLVAATASVILLVLAGASFCIAKSAPPALRFFDPRRPPTVDEAWAVCVMDYALSSTEKNDVVFLGDSICRSGLEPVQFERSTRLRAYNLGVLFGGLGPDVLPNVARSYLLKHPAPRMMVLCCSPVCFERDVPAAYVPLRDRFLNCYALEVPGDQSFEARRSDIMNLSYLIKQGTLLGWDKIAALLNGHDHDARDDSLDGGETLTYRSLEQQTRQSRGFYAMVGSGHETSLDRPSGNVLIDDEWDRGVRRLADTCEKAHVPLMIRLGPISAQASRNLNFDAVERWLKQLHVSHPHLMLPRDHNLLRYAPELCFDSTHPNVQGAALFTTRVADEVRTALGPASIATEK